MPTREPLRSLEDDGLAIAEIGSWGEEKYRLVSFYAALFAQSMRSKWDSLVYIDLFSGAGRSRIRGTKRIVLASPLLILGMPETFDKYIFCEKDRNNADVLETRCQRDFSARTVKIIAGDANTLTERIIAEMPRPGKSRKVLAFCFIDPYQMQNLKFSAIEILSQRFMDFLVLIPSGMDAARNEQLYVRPTNTAMDRFVGNADWRNRWKSDKQSGKSFENFVVEEFGRSMQQLKYIDPGLKDAILIRSDDKNLRLYRLVLYSKHPLGNKFWKEARKYTNPQTGFQF
jgi:three-Cys-motif partner protein